MRILLVEDDIRLAETLAEALSDQLYVVDIAVDGEVAWDCTKAINYDLLLLDVMLPEIDGITLCHRVRSHGHQMPILMMTACDTISNKINGLDAGADLPTNILLKFISEVSAKNSKLLAHQKILLKLCTV